jgi:hypothetical protein
MEGMPGKRFTKGNAGELSSDDCQGAASGKP